MTYSIVARDPETGSLGVAVQSHYFSVGSIVSWAEPGVGAIATQSLAEVTYGPLGLGLLRGGKDPGAALAALRSADEGEATRQVAMVDASGRVAAHTGDRCIAEAGHVVADGWSVQANMMTRATVWDAMADAFERSTGELPLRMLAALDAAEAEGGDIRGQQSAALLVVPGEGPAWQKAIDLRVEDHRTPLAELRRLVDLRNAYSTGQNADVLGDNPELVFWQGVAFAAQGRLDDAAPLLRRAYAESGNWKELLRRLPASGLFPEDDDLIKAALDV